MEQYEKVNKFDEFSELAFDSLFIYQDDLYILKGRKHLTDSRIVEAIYGEGVVDCSKTCNITVDHIEDVKFRLGDFSPEFQFLWCKIEERFFNKLRINW